MLTRKTIKENVEKTRHLFPELQELYKNLPATQCRCETPGVCCTTMPEMTVVEALQWLDVLGQMEPEVKLQTLRGFLTFYLTTPLLRPACPFLENNQCRNYNHRSFACRAYGLWSVSIGNNRTIENRSNQDKILEIWKKMGVDMPPEKVGAEIDYCDRVVQTGKPVVDDETLFKQLKKVYALSSSLPELQQQFESEFHSDFSYLVASLLFSSKKVLLGKFAVVKELHEKGTDSRLQKFLSKVTVEDF
ncbi:MAG: YkgJ family cysteine cluster protein [Desulforhopalus sp.]